MDRLPKQAWFATQRGTCTEPPPSAGSIICVVYKVDTAGNETVLHTFTGGADGGGPSASVILGSQGNIYGTTYSGGSEGQGVVFELSASGAETVLYNFTGAADGAQPNGVIRNSAGNFYGATLNGGTGGQGFVFELNYASGQETVLYTFTGAADGGHPVDGVIQDSDGRAAIRETIFRSYRMKPSAANSSIASAACKCYTRRYQCTPAFSAFCRLLPQCRRLGSRSLLNKASS